MHAWWTISQAFEVAGSARQVLASEMPSKVKRRHFVAAQPRNRADLEFIFHCISPGKGPDQPSFRFLVHWALRRDELCGPASSCDAVICVLK